MKGSIFWNVTSWVSYKFIDVSEESAASYKSTQCKIPENAPVHNHDGDYATFQVLISTRLSKH
jgi:hypothetical protein